MNTSILARIPFLRPRVVHRLPGRLRLQIPNPPKNSGLTLPAMDEWVRYLRNNEGIDNVEYNHVTGKALITFDPEVISEETILKAIDRLTDAVLDHLPRYLKLDDRTKSEIPRRILNFLERHPFDITSDRPMELDDEIWHQKK